MTASKRKQNQLSVMNMIVGCFEDIIDMGDSYKKMQEDFYKKYTQADYVFISEFLACQLTLENLIERDLQKSGISESAVRKKTFEKKIKSLKEVHLLYPFQEIFLELRALRNNLVHELNYTVTNKDLMSLTEWYNKTWEYDRKSEPITMIKYLTTICLMTIELEGNPVELLSKTLWAKFKRRIVKIRNDQRK